MIKRGDRYKMTNKRGLSRDFSLYNSNRRGQVAETTTWIVATLIVVVIITVSVFLASLVGQSKTLPVREKIDLFAKKSMISYLLTVDNGAPVYSQISNEGELNDYTGTLASEIFHELYHGYARIFLGVREAGSSTAYPNEYFSSPSIVLGNAALNSPYAVLYLINLNDKFVQLGLWQKM